MNPYGRRFYRRRHQNTQYAADAVIGILENRLPPISSVIDVGCGVGTWLSRFMARGISDVQGIEGPWARAELIEIPASQFHQMRLTDLRQWPRRYDLAISLEVAEHLPPEAARTFVQALCGLSDFVLFSAAIPLQGGKHHVNEQWPDYWIAHFATFGYDCLDWIRPAIWNDAGVPVWYRQNTFLFVAKPRLSALVQSASAQGNSGMPINIVHPDMYLLKATPRSLPVRIGKFLSRLKDQSR